MTNFFLKPALGADGAPVLVRDPETHVPLSALGEWKQAVPYWMRRLRDGDVIDATPVADAVDRPRKRRPEPTAD
ncbi:MAG: DUF2635 domain-containing protein [Rhizobiaceae bacterium]|nr:DUF2635 domain-containing protein [Rhizobiaceae bacterium]MCB2106357.1 DUF2635 domain-containing protein [Paracoccaceae bacterium]